MNHRFTLLLFVFLLPIVGFSQSKKEVGKKFLRENATKLGLTQSDVNDYIISDMYRTEHNGMTHLYFNQSYNGIPVSYAILNVNIAKDDAIPYYGNRFINDLKSKISGKKPEITPEVSVSNVAKEIGIYNPGEITLSKKLSAGKFIFQQTEYTDSKIEVELQYFPVNENTVRLVWNVVLSERHNADDWLTKVDAITGEILEHQNTTIYCTHHHGAYTNHSRACRKEHKHATRNADKNGAATAMVDGSSYRVYAVPAESPLHGAHDIASEPAVPAASPFGWHDLDGMEGPEFTITRGNNVHAFQNQNASGISQGDEPEGGMDLTFDSAHELDLEPQLSVDADVINLFYMNNMMHDLTYLIGFDEQAGNFQSNTYGNPGQGGDYVRAFALDGTLINGATEPTNNAYFSPTSDGNIGTMGMFRWDVGGNSLFRVFEPTDLAANYDAGLAGDGWGFDNTYAGVDITAEIAIGLDDSPSSPQTACGDIVSDVAGKVALIQRGLCQFGTKALNAQTAGAVAVIICNVPGADGAGSDGEQPQGMLGGDNGLDVTIPTIMIGNTPCLRIRSSIASGNPVTVNLMPSESTGPSQVSSGFDNGVIAHEYGHGISNRLVGGPSQLGCFGNGEQMGEGISDFFSLIMTAEEGDTGADARGIGVFVNDENINGRGIRRFPYSTDMSVNPQTYDDIIGTGVHPTGEIWTAVCWDIYWAFVDLYGFDSDWSNTESGNHRGMRLAIDGMKMAPCRPGFMDMRNALLAADGGEHSCMLWEIFARRGLGYFGNQGSANDNTDGTEDFEPLPTCIQEIKVKKTITDFITAGDDIAVTLAVANHTLDDATDAIVTDKIPNGLEYVDGSANFPATVDGDQITFELGDYPSLSEDTITYMMTSDPTNASDIVFRNQVETNEDIGRWERVIVEGTNFFGINSFDSYSPSQCWFVPEVDADTEQHLLYNNIDVTGTFPVLRVFHRINTVNGVRDGGFIEISTDGGTIWRGLNDNMLLNGYDNFITYTTFAIPNLLGFVGPNAQGEFKGTYIDLSDYAGQNVDIRFRFGTSDADDATPLGLAPDNGWFIDDLELIDLKFYDTEACLSTSIGTACSGNSRTFIDVGLGVGFEDLSKEGVVVDIFPNPASDFVSLKITTENPLDGVLSIVSVDGKTMKTQSLNIDAIENNMTINTSDFAPGFYFVQIQSGNKLLTKKLVIE